MVAFATVALLVACVSVGLYIMRPFWFFPTTQLDIQWHKPLYSEDADTLLAGVAVSDITPPIGLPKMGYGAMAKSADGFRTRLKARAFYLNPTSGESVAIVQVDLPASSVVLHRKVASEIAQVTDVAFHNLTLYATHTHSGPGQYFGSDFYNAFGSNSPGFDPDLFAFLVKQITSAVIDAYHNRRPAKLAIGSSDLYGATKNRSMGAYVLNQNVVDKQQTDEAALRAINPTITLVRLDGKTEDGEYLPLGAFSSFAIHGTAIPPFTAPYHGDVWAFFARKLESRITQYYGPPWQPIHGPFGANHGDNNPNHREALRGDQEARRIGQLMSDGAWDLFLSLQPQLTDQVDIKSAMTEIDVLNLSSQQHGLLCERAVVGTALVGAAHGDEWFPVSYIPTFQRGWPDDGLNDCHGEKRWLLSKLQAMMLKPHHFPHLLTLSAMQINELLLLGLPFELSLEAGNRVAQAVEAELSDPPTHTVIAGHANGYMGYSTTWEEYSAQWYEGGHTLYGPNTSQFLATQSARLVSKMQADSSHVDLPQSWRFALASKRYYPTVKEVKGKRTQLQAPVFVGASLDNEPHWQLYYSDVGPSTLELHKPLASIQISDDGEHFVDFYDGRGMPVNDQGYDLQVAMVEEREQGMARYYLRWFHPPVAPPGRWYRFKLEPRLGQGVWYSSPFR